jgi:hypothetical protein
MGVFILKNIHIIAGKNYYSFFLTFRYQFGNILFMKIQHKELIEVLAEKTNSSFITIYRIFQGSRRASPELAMKLEKYTSIPKENWIFPAKRGKFCNPYVKKGKDGNCENNS